MENLSSLFVTFNCERTLVDAEYFSASLAKTLSKQQQQLPPDLVVLSLQEVAPISYAFLGGAFLAPYLDRFADAVRIAAGSWGQNGLEYKTILSSNIGMTAIMIFARLEIASNVQWIETGGAGVGVWEMGNKGAVGARLGYAPAGETHDAEEVQLTFVAAHLAPMEEHCERRNQDWQSINENLVFTSVPQALRTRSKMINDSSADEAEPLISSATDEQVKTDRSRMHTLIAPSSHTFFGGDLNYRTSDMRPHPQDHKSWPSQDQPPSEPTHFSHLLSKDQLTRELRAGRTLHHLTEAPIDFAPTYKFSSQAQDQAAQKAKALKSISPPAAIGSSPGDTAWLWAKHRHPSWCDRILFLNPPFPGTQPTVHTYTSLPLQPTSDHKPVVLLASIPLKSLPESGDGEAWISPPFKTRPGWEQRRATARRWEIVVGVLAYLGLTWEGRALIIGTIIGILGGWAALRSLLAF